MLPKYLLVWLVLLLPVPIRDASQPRELEPRESEVAEAPLPDRPDPAAEQRSSSSKRSSRSLDVERASLLWASDCSSCVGAVGPPAVEREQQGILAFGGAFGGQSQDVPGLQSGPATAVPAAVVLPSGASSSWSRLSCRGELPRDWKSGGEARPNGPVDDTGVAGVATPDTGGQHSARGQAHDCLGGEV